MIHQLLIVTFIVFEALAAFGVPSGRANFIACGLTALGVSMLL